MDKTVRRAIFEVLRAALFTTLFSLLALTIVAVFVKAYRPDTVTVTAINWTVKCVGVFFVSLLFLGRERALFKGICAGVLSSVLTMFVFAAVGGGFFVDILFLPELLLTAASGGAGALLGAKFRKER